MTNPSPTGTDRIELLQTFVRIVEAGSLSGAATQLHTTQPTVSRRLRSLEKAFGLQLLQRTTHAMRLTADGERCFERAKDLLAHWESMQADVGGGGTDVEGVLRVVVPHAFGQDLLVQALADFLLLHPKLRVEWLLHDDRVLQDYISAGIDCAIQVGDVQALGVVAIKLAEVPRVAVAAPSLLAGLPVPETPSELSQLPWLALHTYYRDAIDLIHAATGEHQRISLRPRFSTDSLNAMRSAALRGLGVCVGSAWMLEADLAAGRLVRVAPQWQAAPLPVHLIYPYARFYPARLKRFIDAMKTAIPQVIASPPKDTTMEAVTSPEVFSATSLGLP